MMQHDPRLHARRKPHELPPPPVLTEADKKLLNSCLTGNLDNMRAALKAGASLDAYFPVDGSMLTGKKPIHLAAGTGFDEGVKLLRAHGADVNEGDMRMGNTPLILAMSTSHKETFRLLLDMGADLWQGNDDGYSAYEASYQFDRHIRQKYFGESIRHFESLPYEEELAGLTLEKLMQQDAKGYCLLDTPLMLARIGEIGAELAKHGEKLTLEQLQQPSAADGVPFTEKLCICGKLGEAVEMLNRAGEQVQETALLKRDRDRSPTPLLEKAIEWGEVDGLFSYANWKGRRGTEMENTLHALPKEAREQVPNAYQLRIRLESDHSKGAGRGR